MKFVTLHGTRVFDKPDGERIALLAINATVDGTGKTEGLFLEISLQNKTGWVSQNDVKPADNTFRLPLDEAFFVEECIKVAREINALGDTPPWFVAPDFLIARALIETEMKNEAGKIPESDAVGPLQVSSAEWQDFLTNADVPLKAGLGVDQRDGWLFQVVGAGWRMRSHAKALSGLQPAANMGTNGDKDRFLPSYLDIFHAHIFDSPEAAMAIRNAIVAADAKSPDQAKTDKTVPVKQIVEGKVDAAKLTLLFKQRERFLGKENDLKRLGDFVAKTEETLDAAFKAAFDRMKKLVPEELPQIAQGEAPWLDVARQELDKNIAEPDARIVTYFGATDFGPGATPTTHWCGAFAAFCVSQAGLKPPPGSAVAANWKSWGSEIPFRSGEMPNGAVVVLSPSEGTGTSGHVAFFSRFVENGKRVELLGGNQGNALNLTSYLASRIAAVRWIDLQPETSTGTEGAPSDTPISPKAINLIVEAEVSGKDVYEKRYRHPIWPKGQSGVTVGIGYDVGYQTKVQVEQDWKDVIGADMVTLLQTACGKTGAAAEPFVKRLAAVDIPFDKAMHVFLRRDVPRWVGTVQRALPNINDPKITASRLGALVSLAYNRGASFSKAGPRYVEMNNIKTHMSNRAFDRIPNEFRRMKRLWPDMAGLQRRRDAEAAMFEAG
jgi:uncharacterized protein (TIGR02594 family)